MEEFARLIRGLFYEPDLFGKTEMKEISWRKWIVFRAWGSFYNFCKKIDANLLYFLVPTILSLLAAFAEGVSIGLLLPTVQGAISRNFLFVNQKPVLGKLVDMLLGDFSRNSAAIFTLLILMIFFFGLVKNILFYFSSIMANYQVREIANKIRKRIYERFLSFGKMFFDRSSFGRLNLILIGYTQQVAVETAGLQSSVFQIFSLFIYMGICFFISWKLMLFSILVFPITHFSVLILIQKIRKSSEGFAKAYAEMGNKISNALSCMMLVKAYSNEAKEKEWFDFTSDRVRDFQFSISKKQLFLPPFQEVVGLCLILGLVAFMAFLMFWEKTGDLAKFLVFFVAIRRAAGYFGIFNTIQSTLAGILGPLQEIGDIFDDENKFFIPEGNTVFTGLQNKIEYKNLTFSYAQGQTVLNGLNLSIEKGKTVAIVGSSGSGKTTLVHLLMRFYDVLPGTLFIDGKDIREFTSLSLHDKMALVSQDTLILNASFKVNLIYGLKRKVSEKEIEDVLERSRLLQLVKLIGLDAPLGERSVKLSGGEKQRLSIARAILKNPDIIILDEATSALDTVTEGLIRDALNEIVVGKTAIVIAHRLATVRSADRIVVLEKGCVVEEGTFEDLLSNKEGHFYLFWQTQRLKEEHV